MIILESVNLVETVERISHLKNSPLDMISPVINHIIGVDVRFARELLTIQTRKRKRVKITGTDKTEAA